MLFCPGKTKTQGDFIHVMAICVGLLKWTIVLIPLVVCSGGCNGAPCEDLARSVLGALEGAVGFFAREYGEVNLDAVVGVRIAQSKASLGFNFILFKGLLLTFILTIYLLVLSIL